MVDMSFANAPAPVPIRSLHHFAWRCRDAAETRAFYEDLLGLPLVHVITSENVPSTGENDPFCHIFFEMRDGSCIAFFDLGDGEAAEPSANTPGWVNHIALEVGSLDDQAAAKARLEAAGVEVLGPIDHHFCQSVYFFDPNGFRLELTARTVGEDYLAREKAAAPGKLAAWLTEYRAKAGAAAE